MKELWMIELLIFAKWAIGAVLVAVGAISFSFGTGVMYRSWNELKAVHAEYRCPICGFQKIDKEQK